MSKAAVKGRGGTAEAYFNAILKVIEWKRLAIGFEFSQEKLMRRLNGSIMAAVCAAALGLAGCGGDTASNNANLNTNRNANLPGTNTNTAYTTPASTPTR